MLVLRTGQTYSHCQAATGKEMNKLLAAQYRPGVDSREQPLYTIKEAARYIGVDSQTLTTWLFGRHYITKSGRKFWDPVLVPADKELRLLSFNNLAEAHILAATRYAHKVPFGAVRSAILNVVAAEPNAALHPLLSDEFFTNGKLLFVKGIADYVNVSSRQLSLQIMEQFLVRVIRDGHGATKFYPLLPGEPNDRVVSIAAGVSASRPTVDGTGIPVSAIWRRHKAGEDEQFIAEDFGLEPFKVRRAIEYLERRTA
jgi:uncharacterized protein (DUF433 family)